LYLPKMGRRLVQTFIMTLSEIEALAQKAIGIDCFATKKVIVLLYNTEQEGREAYLALITRFPFSEALTLHVDYKDYANIAIVSRETADTITVKNLNYYQGKQTYIHLTSMDITVKPDENILLQTAWIRPDGVYEIAYKPEQSQYNQNTPELLNIIGVSAKFIG
jgi:hypothetical protein